MIQIQTLPSNHEYSLITDHYGTLAGYPASIGWASLIQQEYGFETYWLVEKVNGLPEQVLALTHIKHPIFGNYLTSAPYGSYGGVLLNHSATEILNTAQELCQTLGAHYINLRFLAKKQVPPQIGWQQVDNYRTFKIDLDPDPEGMLAGYGSNHRNHVRKSLKKDFEYVLGGAELLADAYEGLAASMHELGSPYHRPSYLKNMLRELAPNVRLGVIHHQGAIAGAGVFILDGDTAINLHANVLRAYRQNYAGEFFYWSLIRDFSQQGFKVFDLGRSLVGSGNEVFKLKWNPASLPLQYWYHTQPGYPLPNLNQKNPKFQLAIETWKRLPAFAVRAMGPYLINGIA